MNRVIDLAERRAASQSQAMTCPNCGGSWFTLVRNIAGQELAGVVTLGTDGHVAGYGGTPRCIDCGYDIEP